MATTRLLLVRHGESVATVRQIVGGAVGCTGLSDLGRLQAERLRERLVAGHEPTVDAIVASTLPRAVETAEILDAELRLGVTTDERLVEHIAGDADGLGWSEVVERYGDPQWDRLPHTRMAPGAESLAEFFCRVGAVLHDLTEAYLGRTVLVSCHGGVIDMALRGVLGLPYRSNHDLWTLNCSFTELAARHADGELPDRWRLVRYNDAAHLAGLPARTEV
ncbi:MAG: histidine phosphatase family protein [Actinobacteria bacterium]|nr:histidine phosphatase family protein [Actinomycetota bacterium]